MSDTDEGKINNRTLCVKDSMKQGSFVAGSLALVLFGCSSGAGTTLYELPAISSAANLTVSCPAFSSGVIPLDYSGYGGGKTPSLSWSSPPPGTSEEVLIVEDPDAPGMTPFVHWIVAMPGSPTALPKETVRGTNSAGSNDYYPPKPPDSKPHHYHFEVFALSHTLPSGTLDRDAVKNALSSGVLAKGELAATFTKP
jgi:phosphatidylethanolamine-binding protein (PEBP) family uncharacterized protein